MLSPAIDDYSGGGGGYFDLPPICAPGYLCAQTFGVSNFSGSNYFTPPSKAYRGLGAIQTGGNQLLDALNQIFSNLKAGKTTSQQAIADASQIGGYLSNPSVFYQARHGDDASFLQGLKAQSSNILRSISTWQPSTTTTPVPPDGITTTPTTTVPDAVGGLISQILQGGSSLSGFLTQSPLYVFTPQANVSNEGGFAMNRNIIVLIALAIAGYFAYTKFLK
jgi:hypothetical protein